MSEDRTRPETAGEIAGRAEPRGATRRTGEIFDLLEAGLGDQAVFVLDPEGCVTSWGEGATEVTGYDAIEMIGRPLDGLYSASDREAGAPARALAAARLTRRCYEQGWRLRRDGEQFWAAVDIAALNRDPAAGFVVVLRDLSAAMLLEQRLRRIIDSAPNAMILVDAAGAIAMVNVQAERMFGYSRGELLGQDVDRLVPNRFRPAHPGLRASFFSDPRARPMGAGRDLYARRRDGSEFPVEIGLNPIETEEGTMVLSAIVDISARKALEERFRRVVESAPNAMVMINGQGRIEMVNTQAESVFGYTRAEMLGRPVETLVPERFRGQHPGLRGSFFADPRSRPMGAGRELYARRRDGSEFPVEIGLNPIETEEGTMVLSAIVDISERKQREEGIRGALREKEILLGEVHHRVKNNLQVVHSLLDLQSARIADPLALEMVRESQNRIRSMALIHQILYESKDFARVEFRGFLESLVTALVSSYVIEPGRIAIGVDADDVRLPIDAAIPCGLAVNELISNALKHGFPDGRRGTILVLLRSLPDGQVTLQVSDDGIGLPDALDLAASETLGLQLVKLLCEQLGGAMDVQRAAPTRLTLRFPLLRVEARA
ncbi:MAG TPA: PAS domain S-box protein [Acetobacteraceae bacterium]|nr:PAS domain S-box protein [Acetobacteraceae bacterium]